MAQNSGWLSTGIRIVFIATFCLLWSNYENVDAKKGAEANLEIVRVLAIFFSTYFQLAQSRLRATGRMVTVNGFL